MKWDEAYTIYCNNLFRQLAYIHRHIHENLNDRLEAVGYKGVKMSFIDIIPYIDRKGTRLVDLVEMHQLPKPSMARLINEVHRQGYIEKRQNRSDARSKSLFISRKGATLINDAVEISTEVSNTMGQLLPGRSFSEFRKLVSKCFHALNLSYPGAKQYTLPSRNKKAYALQIQLNSITHHIELNLYKDNLESGFEDLQNHYRVVLGNISHEGTTISEIARRENINKQNISDICQKLVNNHYLERIPDERDKRSHQLRFAKRGRAMITHSVKNLLQIEGKIKEHMGEKDFLLLQDLSQQLWYLLHGEGPTPLSISPSEKIADFNTVNPLVQSYIKQLLSTVQNHHKELLPHIFSSSNEGVRLSTEFLQHMSKIKIK